MKKSMVNETHIEGFIYEHDLELRTAGEKAKNPGVQFIMGTLSIATDNDCVNIVPVHFTYVTPTTKTGATNNNFTVLNNIINGTVGTIMRDGKDKAGKIRIDSNIGLNEFYSDRNGTEELVSAKRNEGGFLHLEDTLAADEKTRNTFKCDMLIKQVVHIEADPEKGLAEKAVIKGCIFDFKKALLPVEFSIVAPKAIKYFEDLGPTNKDPIFTKVWGQQISATTSREVREESAFGDDDVRIVQSTKKDWIITGAQKEPYMWDDVSTITVDELKQLIADRETYLATLKMRRDEYKSSQSASTGGFNF